MATKQIYIDKPCSESWDDMTPNEDGRHCMKCCKTVVDFSDWDTEDIINYISKSSQSVCGQVQTTAVHVRLQSPKVLHRDLLYKIIRAPASLIRKTAAIIILCFGFIERQDVFAQQPQQQTPQKQEPQKPVIMGGISIPTKADTAKKDKGSEVIMGEVAIPAKQDSVKICPPEKNVRGKIRVDARKKTSS